MEIKRVWTDLVGINNQAEEEKGYAGDTQHDPRRSIKFASRVTIIRGDNGSGKTLIAEVLSLIGHLSILNIKPSAATQGIPFATIELRLSGNDIKFLQWVKEYKNASNTGKVNMSGTEWNLTADIEDKFRSAFKSFSDNFDIPTENEVISVEFWRKNPSADAANSHDRGSASEDTQKSGKSSDFNLKKLLSNDKDLKCGIVFKAYSVSADTKAEAALQHLIAWSRPTYADSTKAWTLTPRFILSQTPPTTGQAFNPDQGNQEGMMVPPGPVGYINTDMYDFGVGIDIRESPKELGEYMTSILVDRLQIVDKVGDLASLPLSKGLKSTGETFPIMRANKVQDGWEYLFGKEHELKINNVSSTGGQLCWSDNNYAQDFVSSGENQAFFLLCYLENLHWNGSILVLDEPELHLSSKAASKLISRIRDYSHRRQTQVIIITHLPHLFYPSQKEDKFKLMYFKRKDGSKKHVDVLEGKDALQYASTDSYTQAIDIVESMRKNSVPNIFFWMDPFRKWWGHFGKRNSESKASQVVSEE